MSSDLEYLKAGREFLASHTWLQGVYGRRKPMPDDLSFGQEMVDWLNDIDNFEGFCLIGAMYHANRLPYQYGEGMGEAHERCDRLLDPVLPPDESTAIWNDKPGRTKDEVLTLLDSAIARLEATRNPD